jgi:hypothetical protein
MTAIINGDVQRGRKGKSLLLSSLSKSSAWLKNHEMLYSRCSAFIKIIESQEYPVTHSNRNQELPVM